MAQFDLHYAYLVGSLLFVPVWLLMYWRSPSSRREMLVMSALFTLTIGVPLEFWLYSRDWWHPLTITRTAIGIEDVIYSIGNGGYLAAVYAFTFRGQLKVRHNAPHWPIRLLPLAITVGLPLVLAYGLGWQAFPSATVGSLIALTSVLAARRDLISVAAGSALVGTALAIPVYLAMDALFPGLVAATWDLPRLSGLLPLGIPIEDLAWYAYTAGLWSTYYKFATGRAVVRGAWAQVPGLTRLPRLASIDRI
jgi:lycopene cyclase-like protein